mgnify:CR=1 FL=1
MPKASEGSTGSAYIVDKKNRKVLIPIDVSKIGDINELLGTLTEEVSHGKDALEGRQDKKVAEDKSNDEEGLESLGRPANEYVKKKFGEDNNSKIKLTTDGIDLSNADVGEKVGDDPATATIVTLGIVTIIGTGRDVYRYYKITDRGIANGIENLKKEENKSAQVDTSKGTKEQLKQATELYKKFVENQVDTLLKDTEKFAETIKAGNLEEAKKQYPLIRMAYERSEPIAESFGELDVNIDFRLADYLEEKKTEDGWRGFHKIEKIMWEKNTTKGTEEYADQLVKDIKELKAKVATVEVTPDLMVTGAVDLLNEVATQKITGEEEIFSHTDLYDFKANIEGAEEIFKIFKPLIEKKDSKLAKDLVEKFATINGLLDKYKTDDKHYKLYTDLTKENTKELSEAVTKLGEPLSQMGVILDEEAK